MVAKDPSGTLVTESMNPYEKPPSMSVRQSMKTFLWNRETRAFMGRTASSWAKIGLFYLIFYGVLAALVAICYWVFSQTIDPRAPKWKLDRSLIGTNPGLGFRPMPPDANVESTLIWFKGSDENNYMKWVNATAEFLADYRKPGSAPGRGEHISSCDYGRGPPRDEYCIVSVDDWVPCVRKNYYNYHKSGPCVFLKLNRIYDWVPEFYNDPANLPEEMPRDLKSHIAEKKATSPKELDTIWVSCEGENPADKENVGPIRYVPKQGFPGYYFPFRNVEGYLSPLVAVVFERPQPGILINVECKAWARNIKHGRHDRIGSVHFELLVD